VGGKDRLPDDEGGHLIASIFKGSGDIDNLVPMDSNLNKGEWKKMENDWNDALDDGEEVKVKITPVYEGDSQRPTRFEINYKIGDSIKTKFLRNAPGGK
jgi:hypothetical protein